MNIVLIGMPGAGKSTLGVLLAKTMGLHFTDTDIVIQKREKKLLQQIIKEQGMEAFLDKEMMAVLSVQCEDTVIATGGSVIFREKAIEHLKKLGKLVYLDLDFEEIEKRLKNIKTRGIAMSSNKTLKDIYQDRKPLYEQYADITINCKNKEAEEIVEIIQKSLME